jgi:hypothetical protein
MLGITLREWLGRMAGKPETKQSASCSERHLAMMGAQEVVAQFVDLAKTIGTYVSDPARFIELELALASGLTLSHEDRYDLVRLRNELVGWNRWSTASMGTFTDLAEVLDDCTAKRAVVLMDYRCNVMKNLDYSLIAESIDDKIVVTRRSTPDDEGDPQLWGYEIEYEDFTKEQFDRLAKNVSAENDISQDDDEEDDEERHVLFSSYEQLMSALDAVDSARRKWDQRSGAEVDDRTWPMFRPMYGPKSWSRARIERDLLAIDPKLAKPGVVHATRGIRAVPLGRLIHYARLYGVLTVRQAEFICHQDSGAGDKRLSRTVS